MAYNAKVLPHNIQCQLSSVAYIAKVLPPNLQCQLASYHPADDLPLCAPSHITGLLCLLSCLHTNIIHKSFVSKHMSSCCGISARNWPVLHHIPNFTYLLCRLLSYSKIDKQRKDDNLIMILKHYLETLNKLLTIHQFCDPKIFLKLNTVEIFISHE